ADTCLRLRWGSAVAKSSNPLVKSFFHVAVKDERSLLRPLDLIPKVLDLQVESDMMIPSLESFEDTFTWIC
ncbi:unnamed protein product, partial [Brassica rapa subsp. trilocularis]